MGNTLSFFDFIALCEYYRGTAEIIYFKEDQKIMISHVGNYRKWLRKNQEIAIFPVSETTYVRTSGFKDNLNNELLFTEKHFQTLEEGLVTIETNLKPLIISEQL